VLPAGVRLHELVPHRDERGVFTELFRDSWHLEVEPVQWNLVRSEANVLRGVHVHHRHEDYLSLAAGRATIGLHDLRASSATAGLGTTLELSEDSPAALVIPPGVAHGFYFPEPALHVYGVSHDWDMSDELGCRWDDPELGIAWPCSSPLISPRDAALGPVRELRAALRAAFAQVPDRQAPVSLAADG
jgi:dTDP-4-dehydrorhamnose 3,5-epimerase